MDLAKGVDLIEKENKRETFFAASGDSTFSSAIGEG